MQHAARPDPQALPLIPQPDVHAPDVHVGRVVGHRLPQLPQLRKSDVVSVQVEPHKVMPVPQVQTPMAQVLVDPQAVPHAPQWTVLVLVLTQLPLQSVRPDEQRHVPDEQICPPTHAVPHAPQWAALVLVSVQLPPQSV
jgi:hypothetical protein